MSAIEETPAAGTAGKDTPGGGQPSGATSTHAGTTGAPVYPHLAYGDAVHHELAEWELRPEVMDAVLRARIPGGRRELVLLLMWPADHDDLAEDARPGGLTLAWSHVTGWSVRTTVGGGRLAVDRFAAPAVVAEAALHLAADGLDCGWTPAEDAPRWEHADTLAEACAGFTRQEEGR